MGMPELPEVEITRRKLVKQKLVGTHISGFWSDWPRGLRIVKSAAAIDRDINGRKIVGLRRVGKALLFDLGGKPPKILGWHFRMSGRLEMRPAFVNTAVGKNETLKIENKSVHVRVALSDGQEIVFRDPRKFGVVWYGTPNEFGKDSYIGTLGPDMLSVKFSEFKKQLQNKKGIIKSVLLDQKVVAGIGNIIVDESLWHACIHPKKKLYKISDREIITIFKNLKLVIKRILNARGSTMRDWSHPDGESGHYERIRWVYGRAGGKCPRCRNIVERIVVGSRGTSICKMCQKL